jgi:putative ABC transport system permease protein
MRFVVAMAWREVRSSWRRLVLFFLCIALGVGAMVSLRSFTRVLAAAVADNSRMLLSADVRVESATAWSPDHTALLTRHGSNPLVQGRTRMIETETIVRAAGRADARPVMVQLRGVEPGFPLRGQVRLQGGNPYSYALVASGGAVITKSLVDRLGVAVGDAISVGTLTLTVRGVAERVPGNALNFSPMPRLLVDYGVPEAAGLTGFGSRARFFWLFTVPDGQERSFAGGMGREFQAGRLRGGIGTFHFVENWITNSLSNVDGFLSLIGLAIVVLGGIGIASVTRVFVQQRVRTVAILKCLGGRNRKVIGAYAAQVVALSFSGSLVGLLVAQGITSGLAGFASARLPLDVIPRLSPLACVQGVVVGVLIGLLFALPPLLEIREVKPVLVLRQDTGGRRRIDWLSIGAQALIAVAIAALAGWMAGTYRNAAIFVGGIFAAVAVLHLAGTLLMRLLSRVRRLPSFALRLGVGSLYRPGNQTRVILFTVGLGALFILSVRLFQVNAQEEYNLDLSDLSSDMFMIDVQPDRRDAVEASLRSLGAADVRLIPVARARIAGVKRDPANSTRVPSERFGGEFRLTDRLALEPSEQVIEGRFWPGIPSTDPEVSVQDGIAGWMGLHVGDTLLFDVAGRRLEARVTSIRKLDRRARTLTSLVRADMLLRPGTLDGFPHTFVGAAKGPTDAAARARLQNTFLAQYPSTTLVDALDDIGEVRRRIADVSAAVSILGGFVLVCGMLTLVGSVAMTKMQRVYEAAVFKTLGAKRRMLVRVAVIEYGVLGLLAGIIGSGSSIAVTWVMSRWGNQPLPWRFHPGINLAGALLTAVLVMLIGVATTWDVAARKPLGILREH